MDNFLPNDPLFPRQWYLRNTGQSGGTPGEDINVLPAWEIATGEGVTIGFIDGAVELGHPDLRDRISFFGGYDFIDDEIEREINNQAIARDRIAEIIRTNFEEISGEIVEEADRISTEFGIDSDGGFARSIIEENNLDALDFLDFPSDIHGTPVVGIAVAANNNLGITGVAYDADFASFRVQFDGEITLEDFDAQIAQAFRRNFSVDIFNNSWQPGLLFVPFEETTQAIERDLGFGFGNIDPEIIGENFGNIRLPTGRNRLGSIFVFAAGNNAREGGNTNYYDLANSRYTITVGALDHNGARSSYSNPGASLLISAYGNTDETGIITTDIQGDSGFDSSEYTEFTGTSAATPIVSGVVALILEANPSLTWRDVQHILIKSATKNDPDNPDWTANGAELPINHNYGFGAVDAGAAVTLAQDWQNVSDEVSISSQTIEIDRNVPDNNPDGLTSTIEVDRDLTVESVEVIADTDLVKEDLQVVLISPDGTESILSDNDLNSDLEGVWTFTSLRNWGESSLGEWSLRVVDSEASSSETTWDSWQINIYGTEESAESDSTEEEELSSEDSVDAEENVELDSTEGGEQGAEDPGNVNNEGGSNAVGAVPSLPTGNNNNFDFETLFGDPELQESYQESLAALLQGQLTSIQNESDGGEEGNSDSNNSPGSPGIAPVGMGASRFVTDRNTALFGDNFAVFLDYQNNFPDLISSEVTTVEINSEEDIGSIDITNNEVPVVDGDLYIPVARVQVMDTPITDPGDIGLPGFSPDTPITNPEDISIDTPRTDLDGIDTPITNPDDIVFPDYINLPPDTIFRPIDEAQIEAVYRFLNNDLNLQFYTTDEVEKEVILEESPQYELEGVSFFAPPAPANDVEDELTGITSANDVRPVYRLFNFSTGVHLYTISELEKDVVEDLPNYTFERIEYYGYTNPVEGSVPLYRFYNPSLDAHFYTPSVAERDEFIASPDYRIEGGEDGIAFYVLPAGEI